MSLKKRHIGRRVAGVGVGVALFVLGLQAPAMANTAVTAVSPTSGPDECVVVVTGSGFRTFADSSTDVIFVGPAAGAGDDLTVTNWFSVSDTEIWAEVPAALVAGVSYTVRVDQPAGTFTAGGTFLSTGNTAPGACAPTITSFTPACASASAVVTITGTNLLSAANLQTSNSGGDVFFQDTSPPSEALATQPVPDLSSATSLSAIVPTGVADGPIHVFTGVDANPTAGDQGVFSATSFLTPPPDCVPVTGNEHARSITLKLKKSGAASGVVASTEEEPFTACVSEVTVKFKFKPVGKSWKNAGSTTTDDQGNYAKKLKGKPGKYKAIAAKVSIGDPVTDVCLKARSPVRKIKG